MGHWRRVCRTTYNQDAYGKPVHCVTQNVARTAPSPYRNGPVRQKGIRRRVKTVRPEVQGDPALGPGKGGYDTRGGGERYDTRGGDEPREVQKRLFEQNTLHMDGEHRERLWELLEEFKDTWEDPGVAQVKYEARFEVSGRPHKAGVRHYEPEMLEELKKQVAKQLELGVIRPSKSEWAAPPHFVKKKTGEWRRVIDYRRLNAAMVADSYPLPRIWDHLRRAAGQRDDGRRDRETTAL
ncbi:hypothetical protein GNI_124670 [Gregarina niphandrodes]|uniref:RNA-directed DNA polymerase n=1 Tax=Gregarina niphandrodes TaxID=110365 RepID=A0A023B262_GRENI|nr:hypothetical protein GNI_124670 [Gregarina niphandrodes]EZG51314.1 hypothetical protein GNI_124670 [Gregarina niphandrodes]|eukprot:XP_011131978.1 hypothetical protein GNI_124670 [Gregarina niphandrodes]